MKEILFYTCALVENKIWFVSAKGDFMNMDIRTNRTSFVMMQDLDKINMRPVVDNMMVDGNDIYWLEYDGKRLVKYSILEKKCKFYQMPVVEMKNDECFAAVLMYNRKIYLFPRNTPYLIVFDIMNERFATIDELYQKVNKIYQKNNETYFWRSTHSNDTIFLLRTQDNIVIKYFLDSGNSEVCLLPEKIKNPINILYDEKKLYISCVDSSIYVLDEQMKRAEKIYFPRNKTESFLSMALSKHNLFFLPSQSDEIKIINLKNLDVNSLDNYPDDFKYSRAQGSKYYRSCENDKYIWFANRSANYILRIDKERDLAEWVKMSPPSLKEEVNYDFFKSSNGIFYERQKDVKILFLDIERRSNRNGGMSVGNKIWKELK